ncbi:hypothetical protein WA026_006612 [Henosepilachna vigintioctopunctata]|uniref:Uncharacterized protein n=1 Tax=Henosepilachna vigintioctopunctata TaxID=420089 RepID=A0AAW1UH55_9CUCU
MIPYLWSGKCSIGQSKNIEKKRISRRNDLISLQTTLNSRVCKELSEKKFTSFLPPQVRHLYQKVKPQLLKLVDPENSTSMMRLIINVVVAVKCHQKNLTSTTRGAERHDANVLKELISRQNKSQQEIQLKESGQQKVEYRNLKNSVTNDCDRLENKSV